jgi:hypothetical protein
MAQGAETNNWTYSIKDQTSDDYGPGLYQYPTSEIFTSHEGLFDLHQFQVQEREKHYMISFEFSKLSCEIDENSNELVIQKFIKSSFDVSKKLLIYLNVYKKKKRNKLYLFNI